MIFTENPKTIRVMFTPFRGGLQSMFGGKVEWEAIKPAMEASAAAGIRHFEFGGGARYQAPYFYVGDDSMTLSFINRSNDVHSHAARDGGYYQGDYHVV
ncbi:MAG: hypothetical protein P9L92_08370 [Candidatus Electryonea clarkiae]|nr:hypothetical protein [Candidatus Electryonea clarkiae]MDP8288238.1 hypothetical protein [Candidatus Electryonea clarkiae]